MKKLIFNLFLLPLLITNTSIAQDNTGETNAMYHKGVNMLSVGISPFTYSYGSAFYYYNNYSSGMTMPPLTANFQHGINDYISVGLAAGRYGRYYKWENPIYSTTLIEKYKSTYSYTFFGVVGEFHYSKLFDEIFQVNSSEKGDLYVGLIAGAFISSWKEKNLVYDYNYTTGNYEQRVSEAKYSSTAGLFRSYVGGRYYFTPNFAGFMELGYSGFGYLTLGITLKI